MSGHSRLFKGGQGEEDVGVQSWMRPPWLRVALEDSPGPERVTKFNSPLLFKSITATHTQYNLNTATHTLCFSSWVLLSGPGLTETKQLAIVLVTVENLKSRA